MNKETEQKQAFLDFIGEIEKKYPNIALIKKHKFEGGAISAKCNRALLDSGKMDWDWRKGNVLPLSELVENPDRIKHFSSKPSLDDKLKNVYIEFEFLEGAKVDFADGLDAAKKQFSEIDKKSLQSISQEVTKGPSQAKQRYALARKAYDARTLVYKLLNNSKTLVAFTETGATPIMSDGAHSNHIQDVSKQAKELQKLAREIADSLDELTTPSPEISLDTRAKNENIRTR
jgi:hypothetical protein